MAKYSQLQPKVQLVSMSKQQVKEIHRIIIGLKPIDIEMNRR